MHVYEVRPRKDKRGVRQRDSDARKGGAEMKRLKNVIAIALFGATVASAQATPEYVWTVVTIQPNETVITEVFDRDSGALVCRKKTTENLWFEVTSRRRITLKEEQTGKWNEDFTVNALRYWAGMCQREGSYYDQIEEDWFDGSKRLIALQRRFKDFTEFDRVVDARFKEFNDPAKRHPSEWVPVPAWIEKRMRESGLIK